MFFACCSLCAQCPFKASISIHLDAMSAAYTSIDSDSDGSIDFDDSQEPKLRDRCPSRTPKRDRKRGIHWTSDNRPEDLLPSQKPSEEKKEVIEVKDSPILPILQD